MVVLGRLPALTKTTTLAEAVVGTPVLLTTTVKLYETPPTKVPGEKDKVGRAAREATAVLPQEAP